MTIPEDSLLHWAGKCSPHCLALWILCSREGKDGSELGLSSSTSSEEEERQVLGLLMDSTGELFPRGERMWFMLSGMERGEE